MQHNITTRCNNVGLRPVGENDLEFLRNSRNNAELTKYLRKIPHITTEMQKRWFAENQADSDCYMFAIEELVEFKTIIGSVALYNFNGKTAEFGRIVIGNDYARGKGLGFLATVLTLNLGFSHFGLSNIVASVHEENIYAIKAYEKAGFTMYGEQNNELKISITKENFYDNVILQNILRKISVDKPPTVDDVLVLRFQELGDERGKLVVIDGFDGKPNRNLPFEIKRIFYIYDTIADVVRGQHANRFSEFCFINITGTTKIKVVDCNENSKVFTLDKPSEGLYLPKMIWKDMYDFSADSVLLVLSNQYYDSTEYIRNYADFLALKVQ